MHEKLAVIGRNEKIDASYCIFWGEKNFAQRFSHQGKKTHPTIVYGRNVDKMFLDTPSQSSSNDQGKMR